jgi:hypothetical protein
MLTFSATWGVAVGMRFLSRYSVLASVLVCVFLVQVLPQVDLPDTAFHNGTAPLIARARFAPSTPVVVRVRVASKSDAIMRSLESGRELLLHTVPIVKFLPTLLCCLLC